MNPLTKETSETTPTLLNFPPPLHLKHRPMFMLPYEPFDGPYAHSTDAKYVSLGLAQWRNDDDPNPVSVKVWRYPDDKWSRMSEELPLHRVVDLCIFLVKTLFIDGENTAPVFPPETFENQHESIELKTLESAPEGFQEAKEQIRKRLSKLHEVIKNAQIDLR